MPGGSSCRNCRWTAALDDRHAPEVHEAFLRATGRGVVPGFSGAQLARRLEQLEVEPESIDLVVVTHEHRDHTSGIGVGARRWGWTLAMNEATRRACDPLLRGEERTTALPASGVQVGSLAVDPVATCHDAADPVAVVVRHLGSKPAMRV